MIIFIYGQDSFRAKEKVAEMKARFQERFDPGALNLLEFKTQPEMGEALNAITASPFMGERRMVIFRGLFSRLKKNESTAWAQAIEKTPESTIVICVEDNDPPTLSAVEVHTYAMPLLTQAQLPAWVRERAAVLGMAFDTRVVNELAARVGPDLWRMHNELRKLSALPQPITIETVRSSIAPSFGDQLFDLMDALSRRDKASAMRLLGEQRNFGTTDAHLLNMLIRQVRILLAARAILDENPRADKQTLGSLMAIHPFAAQKALQQVRGFTLHALKQLHAFLFDFERKLKSGKMDFNLAVDMTVSALLSHNAPVS